MTIEPAKRIGDINLKKQEKEEKMAFNESQKASILMGMMIWAITEKEDFRSEVNKLLEMPSLEDMDKKVKT